MEPISQILKRQQAGISLQTSSQTLSITDDGASISIYSGSLSTENTAKGVAKIKAAFPSLTPEFYSVLLERLIEKKFNDERFINAVNSLIDNCQYPTPTLANILSFDKRIKVYSYSEMSNIVMSGTKSQSDFAKIKINGKIFWIKLSDKELYNIQDEL